MQVSKAEMHWLTDRLTDRLAGCLAMQVSKAEMHFLGLHAFRVVLGRKQAAYRAVLASLDAQILSPHLRALAPLLRGVVEERRSAVFSGMRY
jgi:hypothetical protein